MAVRKRVLMIHLDMLGTLALRGTDGRELRPVLAQPKRLALLSYLAVESARGFQRRDQLFALFWPEFSQAQARQALRQSLYFLRRSIGEHVVVNRGGEEIGLALDALRCDVCAFRELLDQSRFEDALVLYRGGFLPGFHITDVAPEFDHWIDTTRAELLHRAIDAATKLADANERRGRASEVAHWMRYASQLAPDDEQLLRRLVAVLDTQGDRYGALRVYTEFAHRLKAEFDVEPSAETRSMLEAVRKRASTSPAAAPSSASTARGEDTAGPAVSPEALPDGPELATHGASRRAWLRRGSYVAGAIIAATLMIAAVATWTHGRPSSPVVAVGWIQDPSGADTGSSVRTFADLLATDLARVPGLRVVSHARIYDLLGQLGVREETPSAISDAARRAGADELLEAVLSRAPDHTLRLELRHVQLATGAAGRTHSFDASTVFELADRATAQVAAEFGLRAPVQPLAGVTTTSLAARRLYEEGLRRFYQSDVQAAVHLFHAALAEDSSFAMTAYYAGLGEVANDGPASRRDLALALRLADRVSDRERVIIRQTWAYTTNDPAQLAIAESLVTRYPDEPGSELALGRARSWSGDFLGALPHLRRAVRLDSLSLIGRSPWCRACDALYMLLATYLSADSVAAAERTARDWTRMQPNAVAAWWALTSILGREERYDSALTAEQRAERVAPSGYDAVMPRVLIAVRSGEFAVADRMLADRAQNGNPAKRGEALWWLVISLRNQGRLRDALATAERMVRTTEGELPSFNTPRSLDAVAVAQVMFEMGRFHEAAALFDSIGNYRWRSSPTFTADAPGLVARHQIWMTTQAATALAAAGDTARLGALADSLASWAPHSAYFRDQVLQHYVRGLLVAARGRTADAEREFRRAFVAPIEGYSRVNLELGKALLAEGRPRDAIPVLRAPLRGPIEASNYYLTYTDLHAVLGEAFERAAEPDSALVHYQRVLSAWRSADPEFRPRIEAIQRRVAALKQARARRTGG